MLLDPALFDIVAIAFKERCFDMVTDRLLVGENIPVTNPGFPAVVVDSRVGCDELELPHGEGLERKGVRRSGGGRKRGRKDGLDLKMLLTRTRCWYILNW
jgi:hypothetical protein